MPADSTLRWLLAGDPSIRWQVLRDLAERAECTVERERRKVTREGWGVLPKRNSTTYTLLLLRALGLPPTNAQARKACAFLVDWG